MTAVLQHLCLHSAGLLVASGLAALGILALRRDPIVVHRLLVVVLVGAFALPALQGLAQGRLASAGQALAPSSPAGPPGASAATASSVVRSAASVRARDEAGNETGLEASSEAAPSVAIAKAPRQPRTGGEDLPSSVLFPRPSLVPAIHEAPRLPGLSRRAQALVLASWGLGVLWGLWRLLGRHRATRRLLRRCGCIQDAQVLAAWNCCIADRPRLKRVRLRQSCELSAPACWGLWRPHLVLPVRFAESGPSAVAAALRHERVHLERGDACFALLQELLTCVLWFHPAAWWLCSRITRYRELSCDALVVERHGGRRDYALALLAHAERRNGAAALPRCAAGAHRAQDGMLHWSRPRTELRRRIEMLSDRRPPSPTHRWMGMLCAGALIVPWTAQAGAAAAWMPGPQGKPTAQGLQDAGDASPVSGRQPQDSDQPVEEAGPSPREAPAPDQSAAFVERGLRSLQTLARWGLLEQASLASRSAQDRARLEASLQELQSSAAADSRLALSSLQSQDLVRPIRQALARQESDAAPADVAREVQSSFMAALQRSVESSSVQAPARSQSSKLPDPKAAEPPEEAPAQEALEVRVLRRQVMELTERLIEAEIEIERLRDRARSREPATLDTARAEGEPSPADEAARVEGLLRRLVETTDPAQRWQELDRLADPVREAHAPVYARLAQDPDPFVQLRAIRALRQLGPAIDPASLEALARQLADGEEIVRKEARTVLEARLGPLPELTEGPGSPQAQRALRAWIQDRHASSKREPGPRSDG